MELYFWITAVFCFGYYIGILYFTRKWDSTFSLFWPAAGVLHIIMYVLPYRNVELVILLIGWGMFFLVEAKIFGAMRKTVEKEVTWLIVLGAQVRGVKITNSLKRRLDAALDYAKKHQQVKIIVSGGQGKGEDITEAEAMYKYLESHGIEKERIYLEDTSTTTLENLRNSGNIVGDFSLPVAIVTNDFHLYRALRLGEKVGYTNLHGIAASSNQILQLNYLVREFFAVVAMELRNKLKRLFGKIRLTKKV